jgi:hypothetical protein
MMQLDGGGRLVRKSPVLLRLPDFQKKCQRDQRRQSARDIDQPEIDVVRPVKLYAREYRPSQQQPRPDRPDVAPRGDHTAQPERKNQRRDRQDAPIMALIHGGQAGDRYQRAYWIPNPAKCDRGGVCDQAQNGRREWLKSQTSHHGAADGHGRPAAARAVQHRTERECDQQRLQAPVRRDAPESIA